MSEEKTVNFADAGIVYLKGVKRPTFVYDKTTFTRIKYGTRACVEQSYKSMREAYINAGFPQMADDLVLLEVPPNQELIDDIFQSSGRFKQFVQTYDPNPLPLN